MPPLPRVLCRGHKGWTGVVYKCHQPVIQPGEEGGRVVRGAQCVLCRQAEVAASAERWQREGRKLLRDRAKGYGGPKEGEDVWRGFRQER